MEQLETDPEAVENALRLLIAPGEVFEIRALHASKWRGMIGYFDCPEIAAQAVASLTEEYAGIYVTLNPVTHDALYRVNNNFTKFVEGLGSKDHDITGRNWLPLDFDPVRVKGISSTKAEQRNALELANTVSDTLELTYGITGGYIAASGNGAHLLYPIAVPNDTASRDAIKEFIRTISFQFSTAQCQIDTSVFNASRIWRLYGTAARKGGNAPERPHRLSRLVYVPPERVTVPFKLIRAVAKAELAAPATPAKKIPYPADEMRWRELNRVAMKRLEDWVPEAFGDDARPYLGGYRISSEALGRDREEALSIQPLPIGIVDFGEHDMDDSASGHRTPVSVLSEFIHGQDKTEAATWLAGVLGVNQSEFDGIAEKYAKNADEEKEVFLEDEPLDTATHVKGFALSSIRKVTDVVKIVHGAKQFLVDKFLPRGVWVLISRPKMGKTWLTLQLALAASKGGFFLGYKVTKCKVLMLLFEETDDRLQSRIKHLNGGVMPSDEDLKNLLVITLDKLIDNPFPKGEQGCAVIRRIIENDPSIGLVIIDTFSLFRDHDADYGGGIYDKDYAAVMPLIRLGSELSISIVCVHHERKGATVAGKTDVDFMESASGSAGITAAFEGVMRIEGMRTEEAEDDDLEEETEKPRDPVLPRKLKVSGRDVDKDVIVRSIAFDPKQGGWFRTGKVNVENAIIQSIRSSLSLTLTDICNLLPAIPRNEIKRKLIELCSDNVLVKTNYAYTLEQAGGVDDIPPEIYSVSENATELVLRLVEWRGNTPISFLYDAMKDYAPATIRSASVSLVNSGTIRRIERGEYKLTPKGASKIIQLNNRSSDDADDLI